MPINQSKQAKYVEHNWVETLGFFGFFVLWCWVQQTEHGGRNLAQKYFPEKVPAKVFCLFCLRDWSDLRDWGTLVSDHCAAM
jgi:hypothetical protein